MIQTPWSLDERMLKTFGMVSGPEHREMQNAEYAVLRQSSASV